MGVGVGVGVTVSVNVMLMLAEVAVIDVVPTASADARPVALIEATIGFDEAQVTELVRFWRAVAERAGRRELLRVALGKRGIRRRHGDRDSVAGPT